jgi:hypothetical protein
MGIDAGLEAPSGDELGHLGEEHPEIEHLCR